MTEPINHIDIVGSAQAGMPSHRTSQPRQTAELSAEQQETLRLRETCREFESVFVAYLLKEMRATVDKSGLVDGGQSEQLYQSLMDTEIAREVSHAGGLGLAKMLYEQLAARHNDTAHSNRSASDGQEENAPQHPARGISAAGYAGQKQSK